MKYQFTVLIEKDEDGFYVAEVPELKSCYTQAKNLEELFKRIKEVIELYVEEQGLPPIQKQFIRHFIILNS